MEQESTRPFSHRLQGTPTWKRRKNFFQPASLPGEPGLADRGIDGILSVRAGHQPPQTVAVSLMDQPARC